MSAEYLIEEALLLGSTQLDLGGLGLTEWPEGLHKLTHLTQLTLRGNQLIELPAEIGRLIHLTHLSLADNQLHALPPTIGHLRHLTHLNLRHNQLHTLPPEIMRLTHLEMFQLQGNPLPLAADLLAKWDRPAEILEAYRVHLSQLTAEAQTTAAPTNARLEWVIAQNFTPDEFALLCDEIRVPPGIATADDFMANVRTILAFHEQIGLGDELLTLLNIWLRK